MYFRISIQQFYETYQAFIRFSNFLSFVCFIDGAANGKDEGR